MMKTFAGEYVEVVDTNARELIADLKGRFKFATQGQIPRVITRGNKLFLVVAQKWSTNVSAVYLIHKYNSTINVQTIYQDSQMGIGINNSGNIQVRYNGSTDDVFVGVFEIGE